MKALICVLPGFFVVSQLVAQTNIRINNIATTTDTIAVPNDNIAVPTGTVAFPKGTIASGRDYKTLATATMTLRTEPVALQRTPITLRSANIPFTVDIVALARSSAYQKDFEKADYLLTGYNANHNDIEALQLHAQVLYWMKSFDRSVDVYEKSIRLFPQPSSLHLDYARVLFSMNDLKKAGQVLKVYHLYDTTNVEAVIMNAYIKLWNGRTGFAGKQANLLLQKYPGNAAAKDIINNIKNYSVPYFKTGTEFLSDDQPLKANVFYAEAGVYKSWLFAPTAQATVYQFMSEFTPYHSLWMQLGNTIQLGMKNKIKVKAGLFRQNGFHKALTGSAEVSQQIAAHFILQAGVERRPYQFALNSIKTKVMENASTLSLAYNRKDKWLGKLGYERLQYSDANKIHTAYLWILAPVISRAHFSLSGGYAFRYADALKNTFVSKESIASLLNSRSYSGIPGVYAPYFTPENQVVHAVLASVKLSASNKVSFTSRISVGVSAKADNPYLWLTKSGNEFAIDNGFAQVDFKPVSWVNELHLPVSDNFSIAGNYSYDQLLFYKSHRGGISLKYVFVK